MKKLIPLILFFIFLQNSNAQILVDTFAFDWTTQFNSFWGITDVDGTLYVGADGSGDIYEVSPTGEILNTITTDATINFNHGMTWDGSSFWVAEDFTSGGASLYNLDLSGNILSSFQLPPVNGGNSSGVSGLAMEGTDIWYTVYYPDFDDYPFGYAYRIKPNSQDINDTIPLYGKQVYGIATKGDTIFYVTDDLDDDEERIYAYSKILGDTLFSFPLLDADGDSSPRGLHWDGEYLWLVAKRPGGAAFAYTMLYKYEIESPVVEFAQIETSVDTLDWGIVVDIIQADLIISNSGNAMLEISDMTFDNSDFDFDAAPSFPINIPPGESTTISINFVGGVVGFYECLLTIFSNSQTDAEKEVVLRAEAVVSTQNPHNQAVIRAFPNPVRDILQIEFEHLTPLFLEIELFDPSGKKVSTLFSSDEKFSNQTFSFHLNHLKSGNYFLVIKNEGNVLRTIPVVKE